MKSKNVMDHITETRFYSFEELENLCSKNEITVEDFIIYMYTHGKHVDMRFELLQRKGKLFIQEREFYKGRFVTKTNLPMTKQMYESVYNTLYKKIKKSAQILNGKYKRKIEIEDLIQIGLENVFARCGELEKNFCENGRFDTEEDEEAFWECAIGSAKKHMKYYIWKMDEPLKSSLYQKNKLLTDFYKSKEGLEVTTYDKYFDETMISDIVYFEDKELINWKDDDDDTKAYKLKNIIEKYIACEEYNSSEIIEVVQNRFGISEQNMNNLLAILQKKMIEKGFAKEVSSGDVVLGE